MFIGNKKCRIYAACGVSQTPKSVIFIEEKGAFGIFICKLLPMIRTIISVPAGMLNMNFYRYTLGSLVGVFVWNFIFVGVGFAFGDRIFEILGSIA